MEYGTTTTATTCGHGGGRSSGGQSVVMEDGFIGLESNVIEIPFM